MPEGPEVKIITDQLHTNLVGQTIVECQAGGRYLREPVEGWSEEHPVTRATLKGQVIDFPKTIQSIKCKGKFIYWDLGDDWFLWNTLGMTGEWNFPEPGQMDKNVAFIMHLSNGKELHFNDIRHFGTVKFVRGVAETQAKLQTLGPDLLAGELTAAYLAQICAKQTNKTLAEILMNQKLVSGVGNYIKSEALYRAKLSPWRRGGQMTSVEVEELLKQLTWVSETSYQHRGATLATYRDVVGQIGSFSQFLQVYQKETCPLGHRIKREETPDKRTSWWVPEVQT
jgi:formamidopyrimidine-DNA glycosylase